MTIADQIRAIAATGSRLEKEALIKDLAATPEGRFVIEWTYNPFITYGIKPKLQQSSDAPNLPFSPMVTRKLLERLSTRELSGKAAEREVYEVMQSLDEDGAWVLFLILSKDLKCGIAETTINIAVPGLVPTFAVMRANPYEAKKVKAWPQKIEPKLDGQRNTFLAKEGKGGFFTRSGKLVPALDFLVQPVLDVAKVAAQEGSRELMEVLTNTELTLAHRIEDKLSFMLDGEAMMGLFADTGALRRKGAQAVDAELHLYDIMSYRDFNTPGAVGLPFAERRKLLDEFVAIAHKALGKNGAIQKVPQYFVNSTDEAEAFFEKMMNTPVATYLARGDKEREEELLATLVDANTGRPKMMEGAMLKDPNALYEKRKCNSWLKLKGEETEDLIVIGAYPGEPHTKYEHCLGGLIVDRAGVEVRVGGGFSDAEREALWPLYEKDLHHFDAVHIQQAARGPGHVVTDRDFTGCAVLGRLMEVEFHEVTPDGSLRHPRFKLFRDDKQGERDNVAA